MMSEMPRTPWRRTSSATRKASVTGSEASTASRRLRARERGSFFVFFGKKVFEKRGRVFLRLIRVRSCRFFRPFVPLDLLFLARITKQKHGKANLPVVGDDDERVDRAPQRLDRLARLRRALPPLERERRRDDRDGQHAGGARRRGDDGRGSGTRAAAHARGDEHHVGALEHLFQGLLGLGRRAGADRGVASGAEAAGELRPDLDLVGGEQGGGGEGLEGERKRGRGRGKKGEFFSFS